MYKALSALILLMTAVNVFAAPVAPEIDAASGIGAIALVVGVLALIGERRKGR